MRPGRFPARVVVAVVVSVVVLAAASTVAIAAVTGGFRSARSAPNGQCSAPALPGRVVDVDLVDFGPMMMDRGPGGHMRVLLSSASVPAGTVSLRVANTGRLVHELIVLPLPSGQDVGSRSIGSDGRIVEAGSLGEASNTCGAGAGDGINPGAISWVTLDLRPGTYELVCNEPWHYGGGMYTELRVV